MAIQSFRAIIRNLQRATSPWTVAVKRKAPQSTRRNPFRHLRLKARGRTFRRDSTSTRTTGIASIVVLTAVAIAVGYRIARMWEFDRIGTVLAPFVVVVLAVAAFGRMPLGARLLALAGGLVFLLWPLLF